MKKVYILVVMSDVCGIEEMISVHATLDNAKAGALNYMNLHDWHGWEPYSEYPGISWICSGGEYLKIEDFEVHQ